MTSPTRAVEDALQCLYGVTSSPSEWGRAADVLAEFVMETDRMYPGHFETHAIPDAVRGIKTRIEKRVKINPGVQPLVNAAMNVVFANSIGTYAALLALRSVSTALTFVVQYETNDKTPPDRGAGVFPPGEDISVVSAADAAAYVLGNKQPSVSYTPEIKKVYPSRLATALLILEPYLAGTRASGLMYMIGADHAYLRPRAASFATLRKWPWPEDCDDARIAAFLYQHMGPVVMEALGQESNQPWAAHWATLWAAYLGLRVSTFLLDYEDVCAAINKEHTGISLDELVMRGPRAARMQDWAFFVRRNVKRGKYVDCSTALTMILARIPRIPVTPVQRAFLARMEHLSSVDAAYAPALDDALRSVDNSMLPGLVAGNRGDAREEIDLLPGIAESLGQARWPRYEMAIPDGETLQQRVAQRTDIGVSEARASKLSRTTCLVLLALPIVPFPLIGQLVGTPAPVHVMHELLVARPARLRSSVVVFLDAFCWFPAGLMFHDDKDREYLYGGVSLFTVGRRTDEWLWPATTVRLALAHFLDAENLPLEQRRHSPLPERVEQAENSAAETAGREFHIDVRELLQRLPPTNILGLRLSLLLDASLDATIYDPSVGRALFLLSVNTGIITSTINKWILDMVSHPTARAAILQCVERVKAPTGKRTLDSAAASSADGKRHNA